MSAKVIAGIVSGCLIVAPSAQAQSQSSRGAAAQAEAVAKQQRYQIGVLERVLEGAVEHGVSVIRDRLQDFAQAPTDLMISDNAHARGFRLEGYGVFFDVVVPSFETTWWTLRTLDQNDLGLESAMRELQTLVKNSGNANAEQALRRVELQVTPASVGRSSVQRANGARTATGSAASTPDGAKAQAVDPVVSDPDETYRTEVLQALKEAMLDHSRSLAIGAAEWLTIAARGNDDRPRLAPADTNSRTRILKVRGSDLAAYLAGQVTKEEALQKIEVRIY